MKLTEQDIIEYYENDENNSDSDFSAVYEAIGAKATLELVLSHSGSVLYIPVLEKIMRKKRDQIIRQEHEKGYTIPQLARLHGVTTRTIYNVLKNK